MLNYVSIVVWDVIFETNYPKQWSSGPIPYFTLIFLLLAKHLLYHTTIRLHCIPSELNTSKYLLFWDSNKKICFKIFDGHFIAPLKEIRVTNYDPILWSFILYILHSKTSIKYIFFFFLEKEHGFLGWLLWKGENYPELNIAIA